MLVETVRKFWFNNEPGPFMLNGEAISRKQIQTYGGPIPRLECPTCQLMEWLSRIHQEDQFRAHSCSTANKTDSVAGYGISHSCRDLCSRQGNENWGQLHQNFEFASTGCDAALDAPKCAAIFQAGASLDCRWQRVSSCDQWVINLRRKLAQACQVEVVRVVPFLGHIDGKDRFGPAKSVDWSKYDFAFFQNAPPTEEWEFEIPIPFLMYGHDHWWPAEAYQALLDRFQPEHFLSPCPTSWQRYHKFPKETKFYFESLSSSQFFVRSRLDNKQYDIASIGNDRTSTYAPRMRFNERLEKLRSRYRIVIWNDIGPFQAIVDGPTRDEPTGRGYLNSWSANLASAKYVVFAPIIAHTQPVLAKNYEALASGAIPIFPKSPDFDYLGIEPFVHYIPYSEIDDDEEKLVYFLDHYNEFRNIAENAVQWSEKHGDKLLFGGFEDAVMEVTDHKYPRRLV